MLYDFSALYYFFLLSTTFNGDSLGPYYSNEKQYWVQCTVSGPKPIGSVFNTRTQRSPLV